MKAIPTLLLFLTPLVQIFAAPCPLTIRFGR
jgi:hypothetical protein